MIEALNNDYDLDVITIAEPFALGDTKVGRGCGRWWLAHWRDETTLMIAPEHTPDAWRPAHIYGRRGGSPNGWKGFTLTAPVTGDGND
jgi:hypothetical protein